MERAEWEETKNIKEQLPHILYSDYHSSQEYILRNNRSSTLLPRSWKVGVGSFQIAPIHKFWMPICHTYSNLNKLYMTTGSHWWVSARKTNSIANALELRLSCTNPSTYNLYSKVLVTSSRGIGQGINESRCSHRSLSTCAICVLRYDRKLKCVNVTFTLVSPRMTQSPLHTHTPLIESYPLGKLMGCRVWLKLDNLQPVDSFKIRGIGNRVQKVDS